jgi:hypothetical protein
MKSSGASSASMPGQPIARAFCKSEKKPYLCETKDGYCREKAVLSFLLTLKTNTLTQRHL